MQRIWAPIIEESDSQPQETDFSLHKPLSLRSDFPEEQILYPRLAPHKLSIPQHPTKQESAVENQAISPTASPSPVCLSDASNKPRLDVGQCTLEPLGGSQRGHGKAEIFRTRRYMRDSFPQSDPESFFSLQSARREVRNSSKNTPFPWGTTNTLRPKSPLSRCGSAMVSRHRDQSIFQFHRDIRSIQDTGYEFHHRGSENKANSGLLDLTGQLIRLYNYASGHGGFADVWMATLDGQKVAVKVLRLLTENEDARKKLKKRLRRELRVWRRLSHDHIVPLYGITFDFGPNFSMVCPWMENGTLTTYLERYGTTIILSTRSKILCDVAAGLLYLHSVNVIHGDLTGSNVLIDRSGRALLSDFGLSVILAEFQGTSYLTSSPRGAVRYAAPEVYTPHEGQPSQSLRVSTHSDIYSFGSLMLQTLSGKLPYHDVPHDFTVLYQLFSGKLPQRPLEAWFTDDHWKFINKCWNKVPSERPAIREVVSYAHLRYNESCA